jgi:FkbM family methyltransferase
MLRKYLSFDEAISIYLKIKTGRYKDWKLKKFTHPINLRNNPFDYVTFEEVLLEELYHLPAGFTPANIIDAGANIGLTSAYFASLFPGASIISLEPELENFKLLAANANQYLNVQPLRAGLWSHEAWLSVINVNDGNNAFQVEVSTVETDQSIKAYSVKNIMEQKHWTQLDLLKIDVEGSEKEIFEGDTSWLASVKIMMIEFHDRFKPGCEDAVFAAADKCNFKSFAQGENHVFINLDLVDHH